MFMTKRLLTLGLAAVLSMSVVPGFGQVAGPAASDVMVVGTRSVGVTVTLGGTVVPYKEVTLAAQLPGRVVHIAGEEGDAFEEGAELVRLNDDELQAQMRAAQTDLANAYAAWRNAGVQYGRQLVSPRQETTPGGMGMPSLFDRMFTDQARKAMPGNMMDQGNPRYERYADTYRYGTQIEQARNAILTAQSRIEQIDSKLRDTRSIAPFNGVIVKKLVEEGDTVQPGQPLLKFADIQLLQVRVEVPARLMPGVRKGMIVNTRLDVGNRVVRARVSRIWPVADEARHTVTVEFDLPPGSGAGAGMYAEVMIPDANVQAKSLPVVPDSALVQRGSLPGVYVLNDKNEAELRLVRVGEYVDRNNVAILSGLKPGERVLLNPQSSGGAYWTAPNQHGR
jgi:multidrug efflux pump subunit AcrA (membrane-fusion protein)